MAEVLSQKQIDEAVLRILNLKNDLGLFENPYKDLNEAIKNSKSALKSIKDYLKK